MAGVVFKMKFTTSGSGENFSGYLKYIDRPEAIGQVEEIRKFDVFGTYQDYMGNPEKSTGLFSAYEDNLSETMKQDVKKLADNAQKRGALLHQLVISFESDWLIETGIMNYDKEIDEAKLREYTRKSVSAMLKAEGMTDNIWTAAIHKNTNHVHIHVAMFDPDPKWKEGQGRCRKGLDGNLYQRGKFKQGTLDRGRSVFVNSAMKMRETNMEINRLVREVILSEQTSCRIKESGNMELRNMFEKLIKELPEDKRLWKYNMNAINDQRELIDRISMHIVAEFYSEEYEELKAIWKGNYEAYSNAYGNTDRANQYVDKQIEDLKSRLGNRVLNECKSISYEMEKKAEKHKEAQGKCKSFFHNGNAFSKAAMHLKQAIRKDIESMKNQAMYERMIREEEKGNY